MMGRNVIDWPTFIGALVILFSVVVPLVIFPNQSEIFISQINTLLTEKFGALYILLGLAAFIFLMYIAFSKYGNIRLGKENDRAEFSTLSWAAMLFCAGIGSSILYWGTIEWAFYYNSPPFGIEPGTKEAIRFASAYGIFHWGPIAWAIYTLPALPIAFYYFKKKKSVLKISEACRPVLGKHADTWVGKTIDVLFIFGLLGGAGTTLALAAPLIAAGVSHMTGIEETMTLKTVILIVCTLIFGYSVYTGLKKGIKILSDMNLWLAFLVLGFIFFVGPTVFLAENTISSLGVIGDHFFRMATWLEPFNNLGPFERTGFPEGWTIFYWAWWLVYAPFIGLFIARISRGRTVREMILGSVIYGTIGCILFFGILGNYAMYLELSGQYQVIDVLNTQGAPTAIIGVISQLPLSEFIVPVFVVLGVIFLATTFDSGSYILAGVTQKFIKDEPLRMNRLFWACALSVLPMCLMYIGGLSTLQTASIVGGFPLIGIMLMLGVSFMKEIKQYNKKESQSKAKEKKAS